MIYKIKTYLDYISIRFVFILLIFFFGLSCNNERNKNMAEEQYQHLINIDRIPNSNSDSITITDIKYVFLESTPKGMIGKIEKIKIYNNRIYLLDINITNRLYLYEDNGRFIETIGKKGKGPGEYIQVMDFDIDEYGNVYLYDNGKKNLIIFDCDGKFIKEIKLTSRFFEFALIDKETLAVYNCFHKGKVIAHIGRYNLNSEDLQIIIPGRKVKDDLSIVKFSSKYLYDTDFSILCNPRFSNNILRIEKTKTTKIIKISDEYIPNENIILKLKQDRNYGILNDKHILDIRNIYETNEFFNLTIYKRLFKNIIISKNTGNLKVFTGMENNNYLGNNEFIGCYDNYFISLVEARMIENKTWMEKLERSTLYDNTKAKFNNLDITSNPVLVLIKFETF
ncbi:MAG: 6-bladed beta-propeller [bacterium]